MKRNAKSRGGRKRVKVKHVYGRVESMSVDSLVHDSDIANMNRIFLTRLVWSLMNVMFWE